MQHTCTVNIKYNYSYCITHPYIKHTVHFFTFAKSMSNSSGVVEVKQKKRGHVCRYLKAVKSKTDVYCIIYSTTWLLNAFYRSK